MNIRFGSRETGTLSLISVDGQLVKDIKISGENVIYEIPVSDLAPGFYLVTLKTRSGLKTGRIVKY
jgi:hypothetical protein